MRRISSFWLIQLHIILPSACELDGSQEIWFETAAIVKMNEPVIVDVILSINVFGIVREVKFGGRYKIRSDNCLLFMKKLVAITSVSVHIIIGV